MTVLGIDFGLKRIGLAFSDPGGRIAFPGRVITGTPEAAVAEVAREAAERRAGTIVVGLPKNMDGSRGDMADRAAAFADALRAATVAEVDTWDERLTSVQADRAMLAGDLSRKKRKQHIDALAAQIMLQSYLDRARSKPGPAETEDGP